MKDGTYALQDRPFIGDKAGANSRDCRGEYSRTQHSETRRSAAVAPPSHKCPGHLKLSWIIGHRGTARGTGPTFDVRTYNLGGGCRARPGTWNQYPTP